MPGFDPNCFQRRSFKNWCRKSRREFQRDLEAASEFPQEDLPQVDYEEWPQEDLPQVDYEEWPQEDLPQVDYEEWPQDFSAACPQPESSEACPSFEDCLTDVCSCMEAVADEGLEAVKEEELGIEEEMEEMEEELGIEAFEDDFVEACPLQPETDLLEAEADLLEVQEENGFLEACADWSHGFMEQAWSRQQQACPQQAPQPLPQEQACSEQVPPWRRLAAGVAAGAGLPQALPQEQVPPWRREQAMVAPPHLPPERILGVWDPEL